MVRVRNPFKRQDSFSVPVDTLHRPSTSLAGPDSVPTLASSASADKPPAPAAFGIDEDVDEDVDDEVKDKDALDQEERPTARSSAHELHHQQHRATDPAAREADELDAEDLLSNGKERPIEVRLFPSLPSPQSSRATS